MSTELIPSNDLLGNAPVFDRNFTLLDHVTVSDTTLYNAQVVGHHRAPDLYEMIFGTTKRPRMNGVAA
jgi:hypothetical protein